MAPRRVALTGEFLMALLFMSDTLDSDDEEEKEEEEEKPLVPPSRPYLPPLSPTK